MPGKCHKFNVKGCSSKSLVEPVGAIERAIVEGGVGVCLCVGNGETAMELTRHALIALGFVEILRQGICQLSSS